MTKLKKENNRPEAADLLERQGADRRDIGLLESAPILFMQIRNGKCRWPIGDPRDFDSFRFCGCACAPEAIYCDTHKTMAFAPNRPRTFIPGRAVALPATKAS